MLLWLYVYIYIYVCVYIYIYWFEEITGGVGAYLKNGT